MPKTHLVIECLRKSALSQGPFARIWLKSPNVDRMPSIKIDLGETVLDPIGLGAKSPTKKNL